MFNVIDMVEGDKVDFWMLTKEPFDRSRFGRRYPEQVFGLQLQVSSHEEQTLRIADAAVEDRALGLSPDDIDDVLDYLCSIGGLQEIYYLCRPALRDPKDDMVLELAIAAGCDTIVTYNTRDFRRSNEFGIRIETAKEFLRRIGELK